uniref:Opsin 7, group member b n=1 Tax=Cyprinus carpio TaxID=7962 RepID=A0A8C1USU4_CYPCA
MENSSGTGMFQSRISKENDLLLGTVYTIFGKCLSKLQIAFIINWILRMLSLQSVFISYLVARSHLYLNFFMIICDCVGDVKSCCCRSHLHTWSLFSCLTKAATFILMTGNKFSSSNARLLVVGVWFYAAVFAVGPLSGWGQYGSEPYGTACCIDWHAPSYNTPAMVYIVCLFFFCYIVPCTIIILSYTLILVTVRGAQHAVQQHVSPQNKISNMQTLLVKLSVAVCIGFLMAWSPYAVVSMWAAFTEPDLVPPIAFALAAMFAKSSTLYNPMVYLVFKPSFRKSLCRDATRCKRTLCPCICQTDSQQKSTTSLSKLNTKDKCNLKWVSNGLNESPQSCRQCPEGQTGHYLDITPQRTARILIGSTHSEVAVSQLSNEINSDFL